MEIDRYQLLKALLRDTSLLSGSEFFFGATQALSRLFNASFVFVAHLKDPATGEMDVLGSCRDNETLDRWSFLLPGTPCSLLYADDVDPAWKASRAGGAVRLNKDVARLFESTRSTPYEAFVGVPLRDASHALIGHMAIFFERALPPEESEQIVELAELFSYKVQAELNRSFSEQQAKAALLKLQRANEQLLEETVTDHLTQLYNRRYFSRRMQEAFGRFKRNRASCALLVIDVDHFKQFNDNFGHAAGDRALRHVAQVLRANCRSNVELLFRVGGEEFAVLCQGRLSSQTLQRYGDRINQAFRASPPSDGAAGALTVSIGGAVPVVEDEIWEDLYKRADSALYAAKNEGRDRTVIAAHAAILAE